MVFLFQSPKFENESAKIPNGIQIIPVHAETGERVSPKDSQSVMEIFKPGQRPGGKLIDGASGINRNIRAPNGTLVTQGLY